MALYTMSIYEIVNNHFTPLFDFDYPFYVDDIQLKKNFEKMFIDYYFFDEIGAETFPRWEQMLKSRLTIKMPYWKQLYETELRCKDIDFMLNKDLVETFSREVEGQENDIRNGNSDLISTAIAKSSGSGKANSSGKDSSIDNGLGQVGLTDGYLTGVNASDSTSSTTQESDSNSTSKNTVNEVKDKNHKQLEKTELISKGNIGVTSSAELLDKWRKVLINLNEMIIEDCRDLFMEVY